MPFRQNTWSRGVLNFEMFWILESLHTYNEISWGWDTMLNSKFIFVSHTPYMHSCKVIVFNIGKCLCFDMSHEAGIEFSTWGIMLVLRKLHSMEYSGFQINAQFPV